MHKVFLTENQNPWFNLSIENWLLNRKDLEGHEVLFLWRNFPSIIIGRYQNPWLECRLKEMEKKNIAFARRQSGGGAVYHDEGNTNFTFISQKDSFSRSKKTDLIIKALESLNIIAVQGKRHDLYIEGKKVSGSASKYTKGKVIHHGTMLINADLNALNQYLTSNYFVNSSIESKGIKSVRSKVTNLIDFVPLLNHDLFCKAIINTLRSEEIGKIEINHLDIEKLRMTDDLESYKNKLMTWDWLYGNTPRFSINVPLFHNEKEIICPVSIKKGIITEIQTIDKELYEKYINQPCNMLFI